MERGDAINLVMYINKCVGIVPTTGVEWDAVRRVLSVIEQVANGQVTVEVKPVEKPTVVHEREKPEKRQEMK